MRSVAQATSRAFNQPGTKLSRPPSARTCSISAWSAFGGSSGEGESNLAKTEFEQAIAAARLAVVVALRRRAGEDFDLAVVKSKASVDRHDLRLDGAIVRQQDPRRTALDDGRRNRGAVDISKRLGGEDDGSILLAKGFQPLTQLTSKFFVIKREPPFIDDEQSWPAIKASFNAMEQIGKDGRRNRSPDQSVSFKDLDGAFAKTLEFRIKEPAIGPSEGGGVTACRIRSGKVVHAPIDPVNDGKCRAPQLIIKAAGKERTHTHPSHQRRPRRMLSGLLRCGACGSGMSTNGQDKSGRVRIRCSAAKESGICSDAKTFYLDTVERAVLGGLRAELRAPKVIAEYVRTYLEERKRLAASSNAKRQRLEQQLGQLNREIDRLVDAIAKGYGDPAVLGPRSGSLDAERKRISEELQREPPAPNAVALHPAILKRYEQQLLRLESALGKGVSAGDSEATEAIRDLVETVTVFRDPASPGGVAVEIAGRLNALIGEEAYPNRVKGVWVSGPRHR
jgi:hypothetical protein